MILLMRIIYMNILENKYQIYLLFDRKLNTSDFLSWFYDELPYIGLNKLCLVSDSKYTS